MLLLVKYVLAFAVRQLTTYSRNEAPVALFKLVGNERGTTADITGRRLYGYTTRQVLLNILLQIIPRTSLSQAMSLCYSSWAASCLHY
jgi:hypothetical protein